LRFQILFGKRVSVKACRTFIVLASLTALFGAFSPLAHADIYQYVDEEGVVHFTNFPKGKSRGLKKVHIEQRKAAATSLLAAQASAPADEEHRAGGIPSSYLEMINRSCERFGVDPSLVRAIVKVESDYNPFAISRKGAMGLMQLMPQTASDLNVKNSFSPDENIEGGVRYLRYLLDRYEGNLSLALAAYNSGETAVKRWGTVPPFKETKDYVKKVLALYNGTGTTPSVRYTVYVGYSDDGTIVFTDNPVSHPNKTLRQKMEREL
jgi:soluble lytic murein transglycosylase-like protein